MPIVSSPLAVRVVLAALILAPSPSPSTAPTAPPERASPTAAASRLIAQFPAEVSSWEELPNGQLLLRAGGFGSGPCSVLDPATGRTLRSFSGPITPRFSPDRSLVELSDGMNVEFLDPTTWRPRFTLPGVAPVFSPDGAMVIIQTGRGNYAVHDLASGERKYAFRGNQSRFSPGGRYIGCEAVNAAGSRTGSPVVYDAATGEALQYTIWNRFTPRDRYMLSEENSRDLVDPRTGERVGRLAGVPIAYGSSGDIAVLSGPERAGSRSSNVSIDLTRFPSGPIRQITQITEEDGVQIAAAMWRDPFFARNDELVVFSVTEYQPIRGLISNDYVNSIWIYDTRTGRLVARHVGFLVIAKDLAADRLILGEVSSYNGAMNSVAGYIVRRTQPAVRVLDLRTLSFVQQVERWPGLGEGSIRSYPGRYLPHVPAFLTTLRTGGLGLVRLTDGAVLRLGEVQENLVDAPEVGRYIAVSRGTRTSIFDLQVWREVASVEGRVDLLRGDRYVYISPTEEVALGQGQPGAAMTPQASRASTPAQPGRK